LDVLREKLKDFSLKKTPPILLLRWLILALVTGVVAGGVGVLFHYCLELCPELRAQCPWLLYLLPAGGILIAAMYRYIGRDKDRGTDMILVAVRENSPVPPVTAPLIFISTFITHLLGGSAGREGAALQLGGSLASGLGNLFRLNEKDKRILVMCGMAAAFSALFGTPVASVVFSMELVSVGAMYYGAIVPCSISAIVGFLLAGAAKAEPVRFVLSTAPINVVTLLQTLALGILCAAVSVLFWFAIKKSGQLQQKYIKNPFIRAAIGGAVIVVLTLVIGNQDYNGAGMDVIQKAISGQAHGYDFILKILFTAITLGCGFKGGEIVPAFFTGATFGCFAGGLLGMDPCLAASLGLLAVFCGVTNCPLASIVMGIELFGGGNILYICLVCAVSYMLSGYCSLYGEQKIIYSKFSFERHF
jgi:H+/Cl- antiporter ClcA